jgi:hypothetical protein
MARSLSTRGVEELTSVRNRAIRQHMLGRISAPDKEWVVERVEEVIAYIARINETGPDQEI